MRSFTMALMSAGLIGMTFAGLTLADDDDDDYIGFTKRPEMHGLAPLPTSSPVPSQAGPGVGQPTGSSAEIAVRDAQAASSANMEAFARQNELRNRAQVNQVNRPSGRYRPNQVNRPNAGSQPTSANRPNTGSAAPQTRVSNMPPGSPAIRLGQLMDGLGDIRGDVKKIKATESLIGQLQQHQRMMEIEMQNADWGLQELERTRLQQGGLNPSQIQFGNELKRRRIEILMERDRCIQILQSNLFKIAN